MARTHEEVSQSLPVQSEATVDKTRTKNRKNRTRGFIAGGVALASAVVGVGFAVSNSSSGSPEATVSSAAPKTKPKPITPSTTQSPETINSFEPVLPVALDRATVLSQEFKNINMGIAKGDSRYFNFAFAGDPASGQQGKDSPIGLKWEQALSNTIRNHANGDPDYTDSYTAVSLIPDSQYPPDSPYTVAKIVQRETGLTVNGKRSTTLYAIFRIERQDYFDAQGTENLGLLSGQDPITEAQAQEYVRNPQELQSYTPSYAQ